MTIYKINDNFVISYKISMMSKPKELYVKDFLLKGTLQEVFDVEESEIDFALDELYKHCDDYMRFGINNKFIYTGKLRN